MTWEKSKAKLGVKQRKEYLDYVHDEIAEVHRHHRDLYEQKGRAAEMIIASWAFIFSGIVGLYQADILNKNNIQQIVWLLIIMSFSIIICIIYCMLPRIEDDPPEPSELWNKYKNAAMGNGIILEKEYVRTKEQVTQSYVGAEVANKKRLSRASSALGFAALLIVIELASIILFIAFRELCIVTQ